jgi:hypothetical protein
MKPLFVRSIASVILMLTTAHAQETLVEIRNIYPQRLKMGGFALEQDQEIRIQATGVHFKKRREEMILGTTWILNSKTREVVWQFAAQVPGNERRSQAQTKEASLKLPRGAYEVYYACFPYFHHEDDWSVSSSAEKFLTGKVGNFFNRGFDSDDYEYLYEDFGVTVKGKGQKLDRGEILRNQEALYAGAAVAAVADEDDLFFKQGFELAKPMEVRIAAVGEARKDGEFDYGWIVNVDTREKLWKFTYRNSEHAGGAEKNRRVNETVSLPAGRYAAIFVTDDSHSPYKWNSPPPYDPAAWGMTIRVADSDKAHLKKFEYEIFEGENIVLSLAAVRDNDFRSKGFTLKKPMKLRIYALGEGTGKDMADYGWIVDAKTQKRVWEMNYYDTEHGGGSSKNRLQDEIVSLDKGSYMAYFVTDDSHAYSEWNASPPYDPEHWGLTILAAEANFSRDALAEYEPNADPAVLASIVGVRDNARLHAPFTLKTASEVRVLALGEGSEGEMNDYGWIESAGNNRVVWEMGYRMTEHAGGAKKNRRFDGTIFLKAGEYTVYYESDGSHSFNSWNASPPYDPMSWGITVRQGE